MTFEADARHQLQDLAIFGKPLLPLPKKSTWADPISAIGRLLERINEMLDRNWLTNNGPYVQEFEKRIAELLGVRHCVAMCNGTISLEIAIRALGLTGEVIVPSFTFVATAHSLQWQEITPVFCDIDPQTHNLDPAQVERLITPRTTGIIGVHTWGRRAISKPCKRSPAAETCSSIRCGPRIWLLLQRQNGRRFRTLRDIQLPCDEVLQHI